MPAIIGPDDDSAGRPLLKRAGSGREPTGQDVRPSWDIRNIDPGLQTTIGALAAFGGGAITGLIALKLGRDDRDARDKSELSAALIAYLSALDQFSVEVTYLPKPSRARIGELVSRVLALIPGLLELTSWLGRVLFGRQVELALRELVLARNRLGLIAPQALQEPMHELDELLSLFERRDQEWTPAWMRARQQLEIAGRGLLRPDSVPSLLQDAERSSAASG